MKGRSGKTTIVGLVWGVFLWILVPAGLFFAGYRLVGPNIGQAPPKKPASQETPQADLQAASSNQESPQANAPVASEPQKPAVDITVEKAGAVKPSEGSRRKKRKPKPPEEAPPKAPVRDDASGDAAMGGEAPVSDPASGNGGG